MTTTPVNNPPTFSSGLIAQTVVVGFSKTYTLPTYSDPEGASVTLNAFEDGQTSLPSFVTRSSSIFTFSPTIQSLAGSYTMKVTLNDGVNTNSYLFVLTVSSNQPPDFASAISN